MFTAIFVPVIFFDPFRFCYLFLFTISACCRTFTEMNIPNMSIYNCLVSLFEILKIFFKTKMKIYF